MEGFKIITSNVISDYKREFGERKFKRIAAKINRSKRVSRFIERSKKECTVPINDVLPMVMGIPLFSFTRAETLLLATTIVMKTWDKECNIDGQIIDYYMLGLKMREVYQEIGQMTRG